MQPSTVEYLQQRLQLPAQARDAFKAYTEWLANTYSATALDAFVIQEEQAWQQAMQSLEVQELTIESVVERYKARLELLNTELAAIVGTKAILTEADWQALIAIVQRTVEPSQLQGRFVKVDILQQLLTDHPPVQLLQHLGYGTIQECLQNESLFEVYAALRFSESGDWMDGLLASYANLTAADFEDRAVEFVRLQPERWWELAKNFATKKKHLFSHLKEAGVVFTYPPHSSELSTHPAALQPLHAQLAMALHYVHEVKFYSDVFTHYLQQANANFGTIFGTILKGDVNIPDFAAGSITILQQYHLKHPEIAPNFAWLPHVNPEALHWQKALRTLVALTANSSHAQLFEFIDTCYTVGKSLPMKTSAGSGELVILGLNAADIMLMPNTQSSPLTYHGDEDLWNVIAAIHIGEEQVRNGCLTHLDTHLIQL